MTKKHESENIKQHDKHISVGEVVEKTEDFVSKYQKPMMIGIGVIILLVMGFFGYKKFYQEPRNDEAMAQMYMAEQKFMIDSFQLALNGEAGSYYGFTQVIDEFGSTTAGNLACYYAGVCQLQLGKFQEAIDLLKEYSGKDEIVQARAYCAMGDASVELAKYDEAARYFMKAADYRDNTYAAGYLMKAALAYEELKQYDNAIKAYERVRNDYFKTPESQQAEKEIVRAKILSEKK